MNGAKYSTEKCCRETVLKTEAYEEVILAAEHKMSTGVARDQIDVLQCQFY